MLSLPLGILGALLIGFFSLAKGGWQLYLNPHALLMVFGGTIVVALISTPMSTARLMVRAVGELFRRDLTLQQAMPALLAFAKDRGHVAARQLPLIPYAQELWQRGLTHELFSALLSQHRDQLEIERGEAILALRNLAKYPPALGMVGTVTGMVGLFANLGPDSSRVVGPELAVAMTSTFYGLILAHLVVMPLADRLLIRLMQKKALLNAVHEVIALVHQGEPSVLIEREVKRLAAA